MLFARLGFAAPVVSSSSGTFNNGATVTVSGSSFGSKSPVAPLLWDPIDGVYSGITEGAVVPTGGSYPWGSLAAQSVNQATFTLLNHRGVFNAKYSNRGYMTNLGNGEWGNGVVGRTNFSSIGSGKMYLSYWFYPNEDPNTNNPSSFKYMRLTNDGGWDNVPGGTIIWEPNWEVMAWDYTTGYHIVSWTSSGDTAAAWNRHEVIVDNSTSPNPTVTIDINNSQVFNALSDSAHCSSGGCVIGSLSTPITGINTIGADWSNASGTPPQIDFGEIYVDNTLARVEICNASPKSSSNHCEVQIPKTSWSASSLQITVNQGSFANNSNAYLYVVDSTGAASNALAITFGSGSGGGGPVVTSFTLPSTSASLTVPISSFTATDPNGVTGYCVTTTNSSSGCSWNSSPNTSITFGSSGSQTAYAWAKDAAATISSSVSASTTINLSSGVTTADTNANARTVATLSYLKNLSNQYVGGQMTQIGWDNMIPTIKSNFGNYPGVIGFDAHYDYSSSELSQLASWSNGQGSNSNSLITLVEHLNNPVTQSSIHSPGSGSGSGTAWDTTSVDFSTLTTNSNFLADLSDVANTIATLQTAGVTVLYRPFHEMNGNWFWWGNKPAAQFISVWQFIFNYLTVTKGLHNILFVYSINGNTGNDTTYYPGTNYVDIVGYDIYNGVNPVISSDYSALTALGKPFAITEYGPCTASGCSSNTNWSAFISDVKSSMPKTTYWMNWSDNGSPATSGNSWVYNSSGTTGILADSSVITGNEISLGSSPYSITTSVSGGNGSLSCSPTTVSSGGSSTCTLSPNTGYSISSLTDNSSSVMSSLSGKTYTISNVTGNHSIIAGFIINSYTVTATPGSNGTLDGSTTSPKTVNYGGTTDFLFDANTGYYVKSISGCNQTAFNNSLNTVNSQSYTTGTITGACTVTGNFSIQVWPMTFLAGPNGSISGTSPQNINYGSNCTSVTAVPNAGYNFVNWTGTNGFSLTTANPLTVTGVTTSQTITANFTATVGSIGLGNVIFGRHGKITGTIISHP